MISNGDSPAGSQGQSRGEIAIERSSSFLRSSTLPFAICFTSIAGIVSLVFLQSVRDQAIFSTYVKDGDTAFVRFFLGNAVYIALFIIAILSAYIGYRMVVAAGGTTSVVIPPQDYSLLAPLVSDGKAEAIDQYVRLSSLSKATGSFTQLGLTGLPLATIGLTLFFSILAIFDAANFLDLAKLTLGAFIGSFVQRQVERRAIQTGLPEAKAPAEAR